MKSPAQRRAEFQRLNDWLERLHGQHPTYFLLLAAGLGFLFGGVLILILRLLEGK